MSDECYEFDGCRNKDGYGRRGKALAHRLTWERKKGPIPEGMCVLHKCDNPPCVRIDHLFLGTQGDNVKDMITKERARPSKGEDHWKAKLTEAQVLEIRALIGTKPQYRIAEQFGVSACVVSEIKRRKIWKHV